MQQSSSLQEQLSALRLESQDEDGMEGVFEMQTVSGVLSWRCLDAIFAPQAPAPQQNTTTLWGSIWPIPDQPAGPGSLAVPCDPNLACWGAAWGQMRQADEQSAHTFTDSPAGLPLWAAARACVTCQLGRLLLTTPLYLSLPLPDALLALLLLLRPLPSAVLLCAAGM